MGKKKGGDGDELRLMMPENDQEQASFEAMQQRLDDLDPDTVGHRWLMTVEDTALLRFLRGHNNNVDEAMTHMLAAAKWRFEYRVDQVLQEWPQDNSEQSMLVKSHWPMGIVGQDKRGRPVQINRIGLVDFPGLYKNAGEYLMIRHNVYYLEKNLEMNPNITSLLIIDLGHNRDEKSPIKSMIDVSWFSKAMQFLRAIRHIFDHYPEMLHKVLFVRHPSTFQFIWNVYVKRLLNERTASKVVFIPKKNMLEELKEYMDEDAIPRVLGGKSPIELPLGGTIKLDKSKRG